MSNAFVDIIRRELPEPPILGVEVGVSCGRTSAALLRAFDNLRLVMVDSWATYPANHPYRKSGDGHARLTADQQAEHRRQALVATEFASARRIVLETTSLQASWEVDNEQCDFVIIDADHTYGAVSMDLRLWWPKVIEHGLIVLDDFSHPRDRRGVFGVTLAMDDFCHAHRCVPGKDANAQKAWIYKTREA